MFLAVILCGNGRLSRIEWRWLTALGALTYPVYLVHGQLGFFLIDVLHAGRNSYLVLSAAMLAGFAVAWLIDKGVEKPLAKPLRTAISRSLTSHVDLHEPSKSSAGPVPAAAPDAGAGEQQPRASGR